MFSWFLNNKIGGIQYSDNGIFNKLLQKLKVKIIITKSHLFWQIKKTILSDEDSWRSANNGFRNLQLNSSAKSALWRSWLWTRKQKHDMLIFLKRFQPD